MTRLDFQSMFEKTRGQPIQYRGKTLVMADDFPTEGATRFRIVFESSNAKWRQGVKMRIDGKFDVLDQTIDKGLLLWWDPDRKTVEFSVSLGVSTIEVSNVWDTGNGVIHSWHNCAAMIVEQLPEGRRYHCNDGFPDDDFDDIVFRLERVRGEPGGENDRPAQPRRRTRQRRPG